MSVRAWAIKPGEVKPLARTGRLLLAARCAMRVEPWRPRKSSSLWDEALDALVEAAFLTVPVKNGRATKKLARELGDRGAAECNRLDGTEDEAVGQAINHATSTLEGALALTLLGDGPPFVKALIDVAKDAASIPALLAHAGRVRAPAGKDPVDFACVAMWTAIRGDIPLLVKGGAELQGSKDRSSALRSLAPLWPPKPPAWIPRY